MAAAHLSVPTEATPRPAAGTVVSSSPGGPENEHGPALALDLRAQVVGRCWGA
jgi:hypothetical protein